MYRILAANQPVRERRNQRSHPCYTKPELVATGPNQTGPGTSPGSGGPNAGRPSTSMSCSTSSAATSWAGWLPIGRTPRSRDADRGNLSQARHRAPGAHPAFGPRRADDQQVHRPTPRRPRGHEPPPGQRRQPVLRGAVQDPEVSPGFPGRFEDITAAIAFCRSFFPWYNTEHRHAGIAMLTPMMSIITEHRMCWLSADVPCKPPGPFTPNASSTAPRNPPASRSRLDQPTRHFHNRRNESVNRNRRCLKVVDRFRSAARTGHN